MGRVFVPAMRTLRNSRARRGKQHHSELVARRRTAFVSAHTALTCIASPSAAAHNSQFSMTSSDQAARLVLWTALALLVACLTFLVASTADPNWANLDSLDFTWGAWQVCLASLCASLSCDDIDGDYCIQYDFFRGLLVISVFVTLVACILLASVLGCAPQSEMASKIKVVSTLLLVDAGVVLATFCLFLQVFNNSPTFDNLALGPAFALDVTAFALLLVDIVALCAVATNWTGTSSGGDAQYSEEVASRPSSLPPTPPALPSRPPRVPGGPGSFSPLVEALHVTRFGPLFHNVWATFNAPEGQITGFTPDTAAAPNALRLDVVSMETVRTLALNHSIDEANCSNAATLARLAPFLQTYYSSRNIAICCGVVLMYSLHMGELLDYAETLERGVRIRVLYASIQVKQEGERDDGRHVVLVEE